jgi:lysophospholipase L1-like esterase
MRTNRYGLRGPEFATHAAAGETRIAILGSSAVMGTYASDDRYTSSARLEEILRARYPGVRVINAGVAGLTIADQVTLLRERVLNFDIDVVLWYPGANDLRCRPADGLAGKPAPKLPLPSLPSWLILPDVVVKNSAWLRRSGVPAGTTLRPSYDLVALADEVRAGILASRAAGITVALVTPARAYASGMKPTEIERRAAGALAFRPCYTAQQLAELSEQFDEVVIRGVAAAQDVPVIDATAGVGTDGRLFGDSTHLSDEGEARLAEVLAAGIDRFQLMPVGAHR